MSLQPYVIYEATQWLRINKTSTKWLLPLFAGYFLLCSLWLLASCLFATRHCLKIWMIEGNLCFYFRWWVCLTFSVNFLATMPGCCGYGSWNVAITSRKRVSRMASRLATQFIETLRRLASITDVAYHQIALKVRTAWCVRTVWKIKRTIFCQPTLKYIFQYYDAKFDGVRVRVYEPAEDVKTTSKRAGIVFYHGGGWAVGSVGKPGRTRSIANVIIKLAREEIFHFQKPIFSRKHDMLPVITFYCSCSDVPQALPENLFKRQMPPGVGWVSVVLRVRVHPPHRNQPGRRRLNDTN